ncbi:hypothetical protein PENSPDRAFT_755729 [Peniophora sp. CONT]|nr:hypothetical protein PENSPDRAFT_755729 [Peniophora sp. CONT]
MSRLPPEIWLKIVGAAAPTPPSSFLHSADGPADFWNSPGLYESISGADLAVWMPLIRALSGVNRPLRRIFEFECRDCLLVTEANAHKVLQYLESASGRLEKNTLEDTRHLVVLSRHPRYESSGITAGFLNLSQAQTSLLTVLANIIQLLPALCIASFASLDLAPIPYHYRYRSGGVNPLCSALVQSRSLQRLSFLEKADAFFPMWSRGVNFLFFCDALRTVTFHPCSSGHHDLVVRLPSDEERSRYTLSPPKHPRQALEYLGIGDASVAFKGAVYLTRQIHVSALKLLDAVNKPASIPVPEGSPATVSVSVITHSDYITMLYTGLLGLDRFGTDLALRLESTLLALARVMPNIPMHVEVLMLVLALDPEAINKPWDVPWGHLEILLNTVRDMGYKAGRHKLRAVKFLQRPLASRLRGELAEHASLLDAFQHAPFDLVDEKDVPLY